MWACKETSFWFRHQRPLASLCVVPPNPLDHCRLEFITRLRQRSSWMQFYWWAGLSKLRTHCGGGTGKCLKDRFRWVTGNDFHTGSSGEAHQLGIIPVPVSGRAWGGIFPIVGCAASKMWSLIANSPQLQLVQCLINVQIQIWNSITK